MLINSVYLKFLAHYFVYASIEVPLDERIVMLANESWHEVFNLLANDFFRIVLENIFDFVADANYLADSVLVS